MVCQEFSLTNLSPAISQTPDAAGSASVAPSVSSPWGMSQWHNHSPQSQALNSGPTILLAQGPIDFPLLFPNILCRQMTGEEDF